MPPLYGIVASQITGHLSTNSYESIATVTVGAGGQSNITFSSIPSTYKHLQIRGIVLTASNTQPLQITLNGDTTASYTRHWLLGNGSVAGSGGGGGYSNGLFGGFSVGTSTTYPTALIMDILDYTNTSKNKTIRTLTGNDQNGSGEIDLSSNLWINTNSVTSVSIFSAVNLAQYSTIALYGVKG